MPTENPTVRLLAHSAQALTTAELLALLTDSKPADIQKHLQSCHGLSRLLHCDYQTLVNQLHIKPMTYCKLQACIELQRRYLREKLERHHCFHHSQHTKDFLVAHLRQYEHEIFSCLFLDNQYRLIQCEKLFDGSLTETHIHPREVIKRALFYNAAAVIVAHNHPSGIPDPSLADKTITKRLTKVLALVDIRLIDHIIVGGDKTYSFAEAGLLN